jgi:hypothetical protein
MSRTIRVLIFLAALGAIIAYLLLPSPAEEFCPHVKDQGGGDWYWVAEPCDET